MRKYIELSSFLALNNARKPTPEEAAVSTRYELVAVMSCRNDTLAESEYYTIIRKKLKGERYRTWLAYCGSTEVELNDKAAMKDFPPQLVLYKRVDKQQAGKGKGKDAEAAEKESD